MMRPFKFIKGPGYVYDLFYVFILYFNRKTLFDADINANSVENDTAFLNRIIQHFAPVPDELELFFHLREDGRSFMTIHYFKSYQNCFSTIYDFQFLLKELLDHDLLVENLVQFYFPTMDEEEVSKKKNVILDMAEKIDNSEYDEGIKRKLYSFLINPEPVIQKLTYELMSKEVLLSQYYEKNYQQLVEMQNNFDFETLAKEIKEFRNIDFLADETGNIYISTCLLNKNCVCLFVQSENITVLLGHNYQNSLISFRSRKYLPSLKEFGDVITEQNRVDILNLLVEREEVTIKDLEKLLDFSGSTAYYHLMMMLRYNIVKSRNQGRTVFYSLNEEYFESIIEVLSKYLKKG